MADLDILLSKLGEIEAKIDAIQSAPADNKPLSSNEAATYLGCSIHWLRRLCSNRSIPYFRSGGGKTIAFKREDLDTYLLAQRVTPRAELDAKAATHLVTRQRGRKAVRK
jgi:excisionase family DNA binding protein